MSHAKLYTKIKINHDNRLFNEIEHFTELFKKRMKQRKPRGNAGKEARKFALDAFTFINKIAKEGKSY